MTTTTFTFDFPTGPEDAYRWKNPDGSKGGVVAVSSKVEPSATIREGAVVCPEASIGDDASIGDLAFIGDRASIGDDAFIENGKHIPSKSKVQE